MPTVFPTRNITVSSRGGNVTHWTLDKHSTNAHDAFFYIECICNAWFTIEIFVRCIISVLLQQDHFKSLAAQKSHFLLFFLPSSPPLASASNLGLSVSQPHTLHLSDFLSKRVSSSSTKLWTKPVGNFTLDKFLQTLHGSGAGDDEDDDDDDGDDDGDDDDDADDDDEDGGDDDDDGHGQLEVAHPMGDISHELRKLLKLIHFMSLTTIKKLSIKMTLTAI